MKTHYLDFKNNDGEIRRISVEKSVWVSKLDFYQKNPEYAKLKASMVVDTKTERTFTMADFTGQSGKLKNIQQNKLNRLPDGEIPCSPERRREIMDEIKRKSHLFN